MKIDLEVNLIENHEEWPEYKLGLNARTFSETRLFISKDGLVHILSFQLQFPVQHHDDRSSSFAMQTFSITKCKRVPNFHVWTDESTLSKASREVITVSCNQCHHIETIEIQRCSKCFPPPELKE